MSSRMGAASAAVIEACVNLVLVELSDYLRQHSCADPHVQGVLSPAQRSRIEHFVLTAAGAYPTIADIAAALGMSARHLTAPGALRST